MLVCFGLSWPLNAYKNFKAAVYLINLACIGVNWIVYFRYRRLDAQREIAYEAAEA